MRQRLTVVGEYQDAGISGKRDIADRPGLASALAAVKEHGAILVVYSLSRLARSQRVLWNILDDRGGLGVSVASATEPFETHTPFGRALLGMLAIWSQLEADMISARTSTALQELKRRGVRLGNPTLVESRINGAVVMDPEKVRLVRFVQSIARPGVSQREILGYLNTLGVRSPLGKKWHLRSLQIALQTSLPADIQNGLTPTIDDLDPRFLSAEQAQPGAHVNELTEDAAE